MRLGLDPASGEPNAGQLDVRLAGDLKSRGRSLARNRLLEDKSIHGPDLIVAVFVASRLGFGMVSVMVRVW